MCRNISSMVCNEARDNIPGLLQNQRLLQNPQYDKSINKQISQRSSNNLKKFQRQNLKSKQIKSTSLPNTFRSENSNTFRSENSNAFKCQNINFISLKKEWHPTKTNVNNQIEEKLDNCFTKELESSLLFSDLQLLSSPESISTSITQSKTGNKLQKNKLISLSDVETILKTYDVEITPNDKPKNLHLYSTAMTHKSCLNNQSKTKTEKLKQKSYERLEWLGDSTIHDILSEYIYLQYEESEGFMTELRSKIENTETLAILGKIIGLDKYIQSNKVFVFENHKIKKVFADIFEAFIAALRFDTSLETCKKFLINLIERELDFVSLLNNENNYKKRLTEYCQKMKWCDPCYEVLKQTSTSNKFENYESNFSVVASVKNQNNFTNEITTIVSGYGQGYSKKMAERQAAKNALTNLGILV